MLKQKAKNIRKNIFVETKLFEYIRNVNNNYALKKANIKYEV